MSKKVKLILSYHNELDTKYISKFIERLKKEFKIRKSKDKVETKIYVEDFAYKRALCVIDNLNDELEQSIEQAEKDAYQIFTSNCFWFDKKGNRFHLGYIPIMKAILPSTRNMLSIHDNTDDILEYFKRLEEYCGVRIRAFYCDASKQFIVIAKSKMSSFDLMVNKVKGFNVTNNGTPFIEVHYYTSCYEPPKIDDSEKRKKILGENLKSYFDNSVFCAAIIGPVGVSIAPYNQEYMHQFGHKKKPYNLNISKNELLQKNKVPIGLSIQGEFYAIDEKGLGCTVTDAGNFTSDLSFSEDRVSITTKINAARKVEGEGFDGETIRGAFFTCLGENGSEGTIIYTEHFVKIANGKRLLHYSDEFDSFEVFDLSNNWFVENGISDKTVGYRKVFNNTMYDDDDEDLDEIRKVMESTRGQQLTKRPQ